jgi:hypothetical protein
MYGIQSLQRVFIGIVTGEVAQIGKAVVAFVIGKIEFTVRFRGYNFAKIAFSK